MAKIKYDVTDVEDRPDIDFDKPIPKGVYPCKITDITEGQSQASIERGEPEDMLTVEYEVVKKGDFKGRKVWDYIVLNENSGWKLKQLVTALGKRAKGTLDTNAALGEIVLVRVRHETDRRDPENVTVQSKVGSVAKLPEDADEEELEDEDIEDEDVEDDEEEDEGEDLTYEDVMEMNKTELKELNKEEELGLRITTKTKLADLRQRVADKLELEEEEDEEEDEEEEEEEIEVPEDLEELEELDREELEALVEQEDLDVKFRKNTKDDVLRDRIAEALEIEEEEEEEDEDEDEDEEEVDYEEMSASELKAECKSRGLKTTGSAKALRKRLEEDDEEDGDPF